MVIRSLLICVALLAIYQVLLTLVQPEWSEALSDSQDNVIRAQRYLYDRANKPIVLLGSSLSVYIGRYLPQQEVANLALAKMGAFDGLEVVERSSKRPSILLIETNKMLARKRAQDFQDQLFEPEALQRLRSIDPALRQEFQLANLLIPLLERLRVGRPVANSIPVHQATPMTKDRALRLEASIKTGLWDLEQRQVPLLVARDRINRIRQQGVTVVFFEVPGDPRIFDSAQAEVWRGELVEAFKGYSFLARAKATDYDTSDGQHLTSYSAYIFAQRLMEQLRSLPTYDSAKP